MMSDRQTDGESIHYHVLECKQCSLAEKEALSTIAIRLTVEEIRYLYTCLKMIGQETYPAGLKLKQAYTILKTREKSTV